MNLTNEIKQQHEQELIAIYAQIYGLQERTKELKVILKTIDVIQSKDDARTDKTDD